MCGVQTTLSIASSGCAVAQRLVLEDVDRGHARPARPQRAHERTRLDQAGAAGVDQQRAGFIRARSAAVTMPRVASTSRMCSERTSHSSKNASLLDATA